MFCPNCAQENKLDQNFCRSCGLNLVKTAESLVEQKDQPGIRRPETGLIRINLDNKLALIGTIGLMFLGFFVIFLGGARLGIPISYRLLAIAVFEMLGSILLLYQLFRTPSVEKLDRSASLESVEKADTQRLIEDRPFEPARSVTEETTEHLLTEKKTRKF